MRLLKRIKLDNLFPYYALILLVPFVLILTILQVYSIHREIVHKREAYQTAAEDISHSVQSSASDILVHLRAATYSNEFIYMCNSSDKDVVDRNARQLLNNCYPDIFTNQEIMAIFLRNARCDYLLHSFRSFEMIYLKQKIEEVVLSFSDGTDFFCTPKEINGSTYYFYSIADHYGSITVMVDPTKNASFQDYVSIYEDTAHFSFFTHPPTDSGTLCLDIDSVGLYLHYSFESLYSLPPAQISFLIISLLLLLSIAFFLSSLSRLISKPLRLISDAMGVITEGNFEHRIPEIQSIDDIRAYANGINLMLDAIQQYKEDEFKSRLDAMQAQLQYLQLQIRPHFYLNCLKNMNSLIDLKEYEKAQTLIYALSNYLSHAFSDIRKFITVREELEAVQDYVNLCNSLSYNIDLGFKLAGQSPHMNCLPMSLLTFVENSIKHTKTSINLSIHITVETFTAPDNIEFLKYTLRDSGGGFPDSVLQSQYNIDPSKPVYLRDHIGINNVRYRLYLTFGSQASLTLRNEGQDAIVEIITPCEQNTERSFYEHIDCR